MILLQLQYLIHLEKDTTVFFIWVAICVYHIYITFIFSWTINTFFLFPSRKSKDSNYEESAMANILKGITVYNLQENTKLPSYTGNSVEKKKKKRLSLH